MAFAGALGAPGLFLISFLDSSILTFPIINDLLLIQLSHAAACVDAAVCQHGRAGFVAGVCVAFLLARKIEEAAFHSRVGARGHAIRHWVERNGFGGMLLAALLPPPTPFKFFVLAAGAFEVPLVSFASAVGLPA